MEFQRDFTRACQVRRRRWGLQVSSPGLWYSRTSRLPTLARWTILIRLPVCPLVRQFLLTPLWGIREGLVAH
jgi:hypothetical protein